MSKWRKPIRPVPDRRSSLWRQCLFALAVGWPRGGRIDTTPDTLSEVDDQSRQRGQFSSSIDPTHWDITDAGWMLDSDGVSDEVYTWPNSGSLNVTFGFSVAVLVRPSAVDVTAPTFHSVFSKSNGSFSPINTTWTIHQDSLAATPNNWRGQFSNGVVDVLADSGIVPSVDRTDMIVLRYNRVTLEIWINGILRASTATGNTVLVNATHILGVAQPNASSNSEWKVGMLGYWSRAIATSEIMKLMSDPFVMWKVPPAVVGRAIAAPGPGADNSCCPCCGGLIHSSPYGSPVLPGLIPIGV